MALITTTPTNLYHYTTKEGRDGILREMFIRTSIGSDDGRVGFVAARYGTGVYFTSYRPRNPGDKILQNIYDGGDMTALSRWENLNFVITISTEVRY